MNKKCERCLKLSCVCWTDTLTPGDLLRANVDLSFNQRNNTITIDADETLLLLHYVRVDDRIAFDVFYRGEHYESVLERPAFCYAFDRVASFAGVVS